MQARRMHTKGSSPLHILEGGWGVGGADMAHTQAANHMPVETMLNSSLTSTVCGFTQGQSWGAG